MGIFLFFLGVAGAYIISRRMNDVPIVEHEIPPTKYTRNDPAQLFDKAGASSINGLAGNLVSYNYIGKNNWGIPMYDCYFKNGTITRLFGDTKMTNLLAATGAAGVREGTPMNEKKKFKAEYAYGGHRTITNQLPSQKAPHQV